MLRQMALIAGIGSAAFSQASFELALLLQDYTPSNASPGLRITRWDPVNRLSLGSFVVGDNSAASAMSFDPGAPGTVDLIQRDNGLLIGRRYDYSTGILVSQYNTGVSMAGVTEARYVGSNILVCGLIGSAPVARIYTKAGSLLRTFTLPTGTLAVVDAIQAANGVTFALTRAAGTSSSSKYVLTSYAADSSTIASTLTIGDNTTVVHHSLTLASTYLAVGRDHFSSRLVFAPSGTSFGSALTTGGYVIDTDTLAAGHDEWVHGFGLDAPNSRMYISTARVSATTSSYFFVPQGEYGTIFDSAVVVAPEPGTLLALGAGVGVLLRRRKKA